MGRYRPPQKPGSTYITASGFTRLKDELKYLWRVKRPEVTKALGEAAAEGDRSENAEYTYRKKQLGEIDRRVRYLTKRLEVLIVVERTPATADKVFFGAWFEIKNNNEESFRYRIVGPDEFDHEPLYISMDSPMARSVMKRSVGDVVLVCKPDGDQTFEIVAIRYRPFDDTN